MQSYANIKKSAVTEEDRQVLGTSLLTVLDHGDVLIDGKRDERLIRYAVNDESRLALHNDGRGSRPVTAQRIIHYRIVFKEVGNSLRDANSFVKIYKALADVSQGQP